MIASTSEEQLRRCLHRVQFPANKEDLVAAATQHGCDGDTISALLSVPSITYTTPTQVLASVSIVDFPGGDTSAQEGP